MNMEPSKQMNLSLLLSNIVCLNKLIAGNLDLLCLVNSNYQNSDIRTKNTRLTVFFVMQTKKKHVNILQDGDIILQLSMNNYDELNPILRALCEILSK